MKSFAIFSLLAVVVVADSSLIPTDISSGCATFMNTLDNDTGIQACLKTVSSATSKLSSSSSLSDINTSLSSLCSSTAKSACDVSIFRNQLASFATACSAELSSEKTVMSIYDSLFTVGPFIASTCSMDTDGSFCVLKMASLEGTSLPSLLSTAQSFLSSDTSGSSSLPDASLFASSGLPFSFLTPNSPVAALCSACATAIMTPYVNLETNAPFASGIGNSVLLSQQQSLFSTMSSKCSASVTSSVVANAGAAPQATQTGSGGVVGGGALSGATNTKVSAAGLVLAAVLSAAFAAL